MKNPMPVNLSTSDEVRAQGWAAESRDADGHLIRAHIPFDRDEDIVWFVREGMQYGETVTIWPTRR
jgi:sulfur-carrier protein